MNTTDLTPLPARPNIEQYRKQAKDRLRLLKSTRPAAKLAEAQLQLAREHGFESWPRFAKYIAALNLDTSSASLFEQAADAIVTGDKAALESLLRQHPGLIRERSARAHRAALLHYVSANGLENYRQKTPANAVEIAAILLNAGAEVDAVADTYGKGTTLGLVATSIHPRRAGVQIALLELLLERGANINGIPGVWSPLVSALHNGRPEAAMFLAARGAKLDLEGAAGVGRLDIVKSLFETASRQQKESGFMWACEYGRNEVVEYLLNAGIDIRTGQNTAMTGLHWAIVGGQLDTIRLLLKHGAPTEARNVHGGAALGQALWSICNSDPNVDYVPIVETLLAAGAQIEEGTLSWLSRQTPSQQIARIADVLRRHGAKS